MPELARFFGIIIRMFYHDHHSPHFHARYGEFEAKYAVDTLEVIGELPPRAHRMVLEWAHLHRNELYEAWDFARRGLPLNKIPPLG
jgi:hypothetical protein